jgi:hypothetical protein
VYPFFFIAYPVLALVGINIKRWNPNVLWRPLIVLLFSVFDIDGRLSLHPDVIGIAQQFYFRIFIILFFTYGHAYFYLKKIDISGLYHWQASPNASSVAGVGCPWQAGGCCGS